MIAIIGILAALLLPALSGAKEMALRINCMNNQRQIYLACALYWDDNDRSPFKVPDDRFTSISSTFPWPFFTDTYLPATAFA